VRRKGFCNWRKKSYLSLDICQRKTISKGGGREGEREKRGNYPLEGGGESVKRRGKRGGAIFLSIFRGAVLVGGGKRKGKGHMFADNCGERHDA